MTGIDLAAPGITVAQAAVTVPKVLGAGASAADVRRLFADDHIHAALVVDDAGVLLTVIDRPDLIGAAEAAPARLIGRLAGRTVAPGALLHDVAAAMLADRCRRLAVVDGSGRLLGLLCMKRDFSGFCSDADVQARELEARRRDG